MFLMNKNRTKNCLQPLRTPNSRLLLEPNHLEPRTGAGESAAIIAAVTVAVTIEARSVGTVAETATGIVGVGENAVAEPNATTEMGENAQENAAMTIAIVVAVTEIATEDDKPQLGRSRAEPAKRNLTHPQPFSNQPPRPSQPRLTQPSRPPQQTMLRMPHNTQQHQPT